MEKSFKTINEIVKQLEYCGYENQAGILTQNVAFMRLKVLSELLYQPRFGLNELVYHGGKEYYVFAMRVKSTSHPFPEVEYMLSSKPNRQSTTNEASTNWVCEKTLKSFPEYKVEQIKLAKEILDKYDKPSPKH